MLFGSVSRIPYASSVFRGKSLSSGNVSPSFSLHAAIVIGKSELMPTTWAFRLSNLGRSSWKAATSRVQVGVNAPMNPKSTMFFLPTRSLSDNFSCVVAGSVKSGALSPTCRAATGAVAPKARSVASATTAARMLGCLMGESPPDVRVSLLHERSHKGDGLLSVPLPRTDRPSDHGALPVDDQRDRNPADPVLPGDGHSRVEERRQAVTVLLHEWLDVLLAAAVERDEIDDHVVREHRLEVFEALELARAGGAPGRPEAQDGNLAGELRGAHDPSRQVGKRERRSRGPLRKDEDRRILRGAQCDTSHENHRGENDRRSQDRISSLAGPNCGSRFLGCQIAVSAPAAARRTPVAWIRHLTRAPSSQRRATQAETWAIRSPLPAHSLETRVQKTPPRVWGRKAREDDEPPSEFGAFLKHSIYWAR